MPAGNGRCETCSFHYDFTCAIKLNVIVTFRLLTGGDLTDAERLSGGPLSETDWISGGALSDADWLTGGALSDWLCGGALSDCTGAVVPGGAVADSTGAVVAGATVFCTCRRYAMLVKGKKRPVAHHMVHMCDATTARPPTSVTFTILVMLLLWLMT